MFVVYYHVSGLLKHNKNENNTVTTAATPQQRKKEEKGWIFGGGGYHIYIYVYISMHIHVAATCCINDLNRLQAMDVPLESFGATVETTAELYEVQVSCERHLCAISVTQAGPAGVLAARLEHKVQDATSQMSRNSDVVDTATAQGEELTCMLTHRHREQTSCHRR